MDKIRAVYKIDYHNGITQTKNLISHSDYVSIIKPAMKELAIAEKNDDEAEIRKIKLDIKKLFGKYWFTDKSPLFKAWRHGDLKLPTQQGSLHHVTLTRITPQIRRELHTRTRFLAMEMERNVKRMSYTYGEFSFFGIASSKWSRKFVQAKRIYDHYVAEHEKSIKTF